MINSNTITLPIIIKNTESYGYTLLYINNGSLRIETYTYQEQAERALKEINKNEV